MNAKIKMKIISGTLLGTMCMYTLPVCAFTKDETVYAKMNCNGEKYETIVSTHIENKEELDLINDMSDLLNIENTNGEEEFTQDGDSLIWKANKKDIYYQGESQKDLPIECKLKYELEGKEVKEEEIVGQSGHVKITIEYTNKEEHIVNINGKEQKMYTPFIVVAGTILKNDTNKNIEISSGKIINDGSKSIVMGIALPGLQESLNIHQADIEIPNNIEIAMDTTDFELGNIITFVTPKILEEDDLKIFDELDKIYDKVNTLENASNQIEEGANTLREGTNTYCEKSKEFNSAMNQVASGVTSANKNYAKIDDGIGSLEEGSTVINTGVNTLKQGTTSVLEGVSTMSSSVDALANGSKGIKEGVTSIDSNLTTLISGKKSENNGYEGLNTLLNTNKALLNTLKTQCGTDNQEINTTIAQLEAVIAKQETAIKQMEGAGNAVENGLKTLQSSVESGLVPGTETLNSGLNQLNDGIKQMEQNLPTLSEGINQLSAGTKELSNGAKVLNKGSKEMKSGLNVLNEGSNQLASANNQLTEGANTIAEGANSLAEGIKTFNEEGVKKICDYLNGDVKDISQRVDKLIELSNEYNNFTMLNGENDGSVKFIMIMDAIKKQEDSEKGKESAILSTDKSDKN